MIQFPIIKDLDDYVKDILNNISFTKNLEFDGFIDISAEELNKMLTYKYSNFPLFERIKEMSEKIAYNNYAGNTKYARSIEKILKENLNIKLDLKAIFNNFFISKYSKYKDKIDGNYLYYEDACIFLYLKSLLVGFNTNHVIKQVVIDEAQDYSLIQYIILKKIFKRASFTILGDTNQTINPYYHYNSLDEISKIIESKYLKLTKTYRSSPEIIEYANKILNLNHVVAVRNSKVIPVIEKNSSNVLDLIDDIKSNIDKFKRIAIITKNDLDTNYIYNNLKDKFNISNMLNVITNPNLVVIPAYLAKGLEFDMVIVYTTFENKFLKRDKYLYYVAVTRCQHKLIIYNNSYNF